MKNYITEEMWNELESILMKAEIPYHVKWDGLSTDVVYDKCITIIQKEVSRNVIK